MVLGILWIKFILLTLEKKIEPKISTHLTGTVIKCC